MTAYLVLENGSVYHGKHFGAIQDTSGEVVFQTGHVGYVESLTDPSYRKQILVLTYPLIGNYGVPDTQAVDEHGLLKWVESHRIWAAGLIVGELSKQFSHFNAKRSLHDWLKENNIPGIEGIDTRELTKQLRTHGTLLGRIIYDPLLLNQQIDFLNPNLENLVEQVSVTKRMVFNSAGKTRILMVDCGVKYNQIRCFLKRNCRVELVPWNFKFQDHLNEFDGLFLSNGPGDPEQCRETIENLKKMLDLPNPKPIFGICLGHQLLSLSSGAKTYKIKFGNRGQNLPCLFHKTGSCFVTSQNHGFAVDSSSLSKGWEQLFFNVNDLTNEGIVHQEKPFFSVQFHPEHHPGPDDMEFLFDVFIQKLTDQRSIVDLITSHIKPTLTEYPLNKQQLKKYKKVLILGSGALSIGQAGEFDYSGSQAIKALKENDVQSILINPNIATVQTSPGLAEKVYFLPITLEFVTEVIRLERPDGILLMFGGQTALNCGIELEEKGVFKQYNVQVLGTQIKSIIKTEDRKKFSETVQAIGGQVAPNKAVESFEEALKFANEINYPILVRAEFALGGAGSGFASNQSELEKLVKQAFIHSKQVLLDKSLKGWKEVEYEVVRDAYDNCVTVCNMENIDPLGVHTGESIVVCPSQTLTDADYYRLRSMAIKIVRHLNIVGECNVQYAVDPDSEEFYIIEVNARLSRSSALASKATGYPLAYIAAKLALGLPLPELLNSVTKTTTSFFEPSLDYCVIKTPRWDLSKFSGVSHRIGSSMKSIGEVMAIGRTFEEAFQKSLRMVDENVNGFDSNLRPVNDNELEYPTDKRIFVIAAALEAGYSIEKLHNLTRIDRWFLNKMKNIIDYQNTLKQLRPNHESIESTDVELIREAKKLGFSDKQIASCFQLNELLIRHFREQNNIYPSVKQVDTVAGEFPAITNYLYLTYNGNEHDLEFNLEKALNVNEDSVIVLGSGVYRIGSSVEFDCCAVGCAQEVKKCGKKTIMVNCNPETVSTDYDICDRLYFDEISLEVVLDIYRLEQPFGIILSMGGQLPNNIAIDLYKQNVRILGTSPNNIDQAENRFKFSHLLDTIDIEQPNWLNATCVDDAKEFCQKVGYPCIIRPSYVLSGAAMNVATNSSDLERFLKAAKTVSQEFPVVVSKYIIDAKEIDVDAVCKEGELICLAVSEHVENAGVHSGDATLVCPPQDLNRETLTKIREIAESIGKALNVNGPYNMQLIAKDSQLKVIECNLRVSRSFPFVSKTLNCDFVAIATRVILNESFDALKAQIVDQNLSQNIKAMNASNAVNRVGVKVPQFSFSRLSGADVNLGVEMASTGEVACFGENRYEAYLKAMISTGFRIPTKKKAYLSIGSYKHKQELMYSVRTLRNMGYELYASLGTADYYNGHDIKVQPLSSPFEEQEDKLDGIVQESIVDRIADYLAEMEFDLIINLPMRIYGSRRVSTLGYRTRRYAVDHSVPLISDVKCAKLLITALKLITGSPVVKPHIDCLTSRKLIRLPGLIDIHVHLRVPGASHKEDFSTGTSAALAGGVTLVCAMPNTDPAIVNESSLQLVRKIANEQARCDYAFYLGATTTNAVELAKIVSKPFRNGVLGLKMYLNSTYGTLTMNRMQDWRAHFENWPKDMPLVCHAEGTTTAAIIWFAQRFNRSVHICHVAREEEIEIIKEAKSSGLNVTCEVCPHHLFLCEDDVKQIGETKARVKPELCSKNDQDALWRNLDIIDCFATDHAPHTLAEKLQATNTPPGFPGLETMLPLLLTAVNQGRLTLEDVIQKLYFNPKKIFNLPDQPDTYIEVDLDHEWTIQSSTYSKAGWTPFENKKVQGKVRRVVLRGEVAFVDGEILVDAGFGQELLLKTYDKPSIIPTITSPTDVLKELNVNTSENNDYLQPLIGISPNPAQHNIEVRNRNRSFSIDDSQLLGTSLNTSFGGNYLTVTKRNEDKLTQEMYNSMFSALNYQERIVYHSKNENAYKQLINKSVLNVEPFTRDILRNVFDLAKTYKLNDEKGKPLDHILKGKRIGSLFYENSTRTKCSFKAASKALGAQFNGLSLQTSSVTKGESFEDTVSMMSNYNHLLIIRHNELGAMERASKVANVPIINAGCGIGEHPTQSLLDIFTIKEERGTVNNLEITFVGDLKHGRTVHSLAKLLTNYDIKCLNYVSPVGLEMPVEIREFLFRKGIKQNDYSKLEDVLSSTDILYMTRIQKERFEDQRAYEASYGKFILTPQLMCKARKNLVVMHPLPRNNEISRECDLDPRAAYMRQAKYGLYVRMALLSMIMNRV